MVMLGPEHYCGQDGYSNTCLQLQQAWLNVQSYVLGVLCQL